MDLGGLEKYLKTALYGMTCLAPNYCLLCVAPRAGGTSGSALCGLPRTTYEHIAVALALEVPLALVLTQVHAPAPVVAHPRDDLGHVSARLDLPSHDSN